MRKALQKQKESIAYRTAVLELLRRGILTDTELAAEIRDDNLECSWRAGRFDMCDWLKIDPVAQEEKPSQAQGRGRKAGAEEELWPCHRDERALDDEDDLDPSEWRRSTVEEKFAYILPAEGSSSHQGMRQCLEEGDIMTNEDVANVRRLGAAAVDTSLVSLQEGMLAYERELKETLVEKLKEYEKKAAQRAELTFQEDLWVLKRSRVIGMMPTGENALSCSPPCPTGDSLSHGQMFAATERKSYERQEQNYNVK
nr:uncharacterized protein LOC122173006 [Chrysemys picta bellii]